MRVGKLFRYGVLFWVVALVLIGCSRTDPTSLEARFALPDYVRDAPPSVKAAYEYAVNNPEELAKYPCYCGCGAMGHTSNLSCFVKSIAVNGAVVFDSHAAGCGICVDIARDVMRLKGEGWSSLKVRQYIDATYSAFGPGTNTPLPND